MIFNEKLSIWKKSRFIKCGMKYKFWINYLILNIVLHNFYVWNYRFVDISDVNMHFTFCVFKTGVWYFPYFHKKLEGKFVCNYKSFQSCQEMPQENVGIITHHDTLRKEYWPNKCKIKTSRIFCFVTQSNIEII